jgi:hypothetical protein
MKTIAIIINGINLPYHVIDYAINKAKKMSSEIFALFLKGKHEPPKGYGYPSDLSTTETWESEEEAINEDEKLISDNMKMVRQMIENEKIFYNSVLKTNASIEDITEITTAADLIVIDENFDEGFVLSDNKISLEALKQEFKNRIEIIPS